jgi:Na+-driven multidrug efflux pump
MAVTRPLLIVVTRMNRALPYVGLMVACFGVNVALNAALLPTIGIEGASIASSIAYLMLAAAIVVWSARASDLSLRQLLMPQPDDWSTISRVLARIRPRRLR